MFMVVLILVYINPTSQVCRPKISESHPDKDGYCQIECDFSSCCNVSRIIYEKTGLYEQSSWTPVFEGISKTNFHALNTTTNKYTLKNRTDFTVFHTKQLLYINPLVPKDGGEWRCVVFGDFSHNRTSPGLEVNIYVPPEDANINISQRNRELVVGQTTEFTCIADCLYPHPEVVWKANGREYATGVTANTQHDDGSWFVKNTIRLGFHEAGNNQLSCVMKTPTRNPWLLTDISIDVKDPSDVLRPEKEINITLGADLSYTLNCSGIGYKPELTWTKNGVYIRENDTRFIMEQICNDSVCEGSLTSKPVDQTLVCEDKEEYEGMYACVIFLKTPYQSEHVSPHMNVYLPRNLCEKSYVGTIIWFTLLCVLVILVTLAAVYVMTKKNCRDTSPKDETGAVSRDNTRAGPSSMEMQQGTEEPDDILDHTALLEDNGENSPSSRPGDRPEKTRNSIEKAERSEHSNKADRECSSINSGLNRTGKPSPSNETRRDETPENKHRLLRRNTDQHLPSVPADQQEKKRNSYTNDAYTEQSGDQQEKKRNSYTNDACTEQSGDQQQNKRNSYTNDAYTEQSGD